MKLLFKILIWLGIISSLFYAPMFFHNNFDFINPYVSIIIANFSVLYLIMTFYYLIFNYKQSKKIFKHQRKTIGGYKYLSLGLIVITTGLTYFVGKNTTNNNFKNDSEVIQYSDYTHPIVRYYTSILTIFDSSIVITDSKREIEDYDDMKLKRLTTSKHLIQSDGYSHALDLRTKDKGIVSVFMIGFYYNMLGFYTLEHIGTGIHLHIHIK